MAGVLRLDAAGLLFRINGWWVASRIFAKRGGAYVGMNGCSHEQRCSRLTGGFLVENGLIAVDFHCAPFQLNYVQQRSDFTCVALLRLEAGALAFGEATFAVESHILSFEPVKLMEATPLDLEKARAKARVDSFALLPGLKPRPTSKPSFSAACEVVPCYKTLLTGFFIKLIFNYLTPAMSIHREVWHWWNLRQ